MKTRSILLSASIVIGIAQAQYFVFPDCQNGPLSGLAICNTSLSARDRAEGLVRNLTLQEKLPLMQNRSPGLQRLALPAYNWWGESLHGLAGAPGVNFSDETGGEYSYATSFPQPITIAAGFDDALVHAIGEAISTEARAYSNDLRAPLDYWSPHINLFKDPRWGRGQETPGEDPHVVQQYTRNMVSGMQGSDPETYKIIATCKHYAAYDMESFQGTTRYEFNAEVTTQELTEYYLQPFMECVRAKVGSFMCSYNAVNGVPACANDYLIQTVLRGHWNWTAEENYITSDCTAIQNMFSDHDAFASRQVTAAAAINAGVDTDCGYYIPTYSPSAFEQGLFNESTIDTHLIRLYSALVKTGYFDPANSSDYRNITWSDVSTPEAEALALRSAEQGMVLLKNDGVLPLQLPTEKNTSILMVGGWLNATTQMQGTYTGTARTIVSPWSALQNVSNVNITVVQWYQSPLLIAQQIDPDIILIVDATSESAEETSDRNTIAWAGLQIDAVEMLASYGKPTILAHMGEQCDDAPFLSNSNVSAIVYGGYPSMFGGQALINILLGDTAPAGRMPVTQYPTDYVKNFTMFDMSLRPDDQGNPGRTYKWYNNATVDFGYGLHYTNFSTAVTNSISSNTFDIQSLVSGCDHSTAFNLDQCVFAPSGISSIQVNVTNTGGQTSDFVTLAFVAGQFGPAPYPLKSLVAYQRLFNVTAGSSQMADMNITLGGLARYTETGDEVLFPGSYSILIDVPTQTSWNFTLTGEAFMIDKWPENTS